MELKLGEQCQELWERCGVGIKMGGFWLFLLTREGTVTLLALDLGLWLDCDHLGHPVLCLPSGARLEGHRH